MLFMNECDIEEAKSAYANHPILHRAADTLYGLMVATNDVSDGWPYWRKPARAAKQLMMLIQTQRGRTNVVTEEELRKAYIPIKALLTRHAKVFAGNSISF